MATSYLSENKRLTRQFHCWHDTDMKSTKKCEMCDNLTPIVRRYVHRFCSTDCELKWRRNQFKGNKLRVGISPSGSCFMPGHKPWNKGKSGTHFSPSTEFKPGRVVECKYQVGDISKRIDKQGTERVFIKVASPNTWRPRAVVVYEIVNGPVPKGMVIHHKDEDATNDSIENLQCITRAEHVRIHRAGRPSLIKGKKMPVSIKPCDMCGAEFSSGPQGKFCRPCAKLRKSKNNKKYKQTKKQKQNQDDLE